ncbi:hypothetical protein KY284_008640 [Solanum tuberosum]|nr:hypothetical protein KY284_008640 [Solanum tuberosum]
MPQCSWDEFKSRCNLHFGPASRSQKLGEMAKLRQIGSMADYEERSKTTDFSPQQPTIFVKKLTRSELDEIRCKGLCLNYDELFLWGKECKKLFWIDFIDDEEEFAEKETAEGIQALIMRTKIKERKILEIIKASRRNRSSKLRSITDQASSVIGGTPNTGCIRSIGGTPNTAFC